MASRALRPWLFGLTCTVLACSLLWTFAQHGAMRFAVASTAGIAVAAWASRSAPVERSLLLILATCVSVGMTNAEMLSMWPATAGLVALAGYVCFTHRSSRSLQALGILIVATLVVAWVWLVAPLTSDGWSEPVPAGPRRAAAAADPSAWSSPPMDPDRAGLAFVAVVLAIVVVVAGRSIAGIRGMFAHSRGETDRVSRIAQRVDADRADLERRHELAQELHDSIGHHLTAMVVQAEAGHVSSPDRALDSIGTLGREALQELEAVLFGLRQAPRPGGELTRIHTHLVPPLHAAGLEVTVTVAAQDLSAALEHTVYRIVQESLTNVMRHAQATRVRVVVDETENGNIRVLVADDGVGLPEALRRGAGLQSIRRRAEEASGTVAVRSSSPHGVTVEAVLPRDAG
ncbi:hypothetical protein AERYTH_16905 [Aeromicrobium erythreum]|uniref:histidine kinase n=1 Tax=Aeromicrobium erythreum TaxID=2041 RepID=A0A0U4B157_9ACTN|nr:hypothetical protein AERYTH_16905 [Aeromicrobium erythreum]